MPILIALVVDGLVQFVVSVIGEFPQGFQLCPLTGIFPLDNRLRVYFDIRQTEDVLREQQFYFREVSDQKARRIGSRRKLFGQIPGGSLLE